MIANQLAKISRKWSYKLNPFSIVNTQDAIMQTSPFNHIVIKDFLKPDGYQAICDYYDDVRSYGVSEGVSRLHLSRFSHYDAYQYIIPPTVLYPLSFFYSVEWRDYVADLFRLRLTNEVMLELHHHKIGSERGYVHNDYNLVSFTEKPIGNGMNPWQFGSRYFVKENEVGLFPDLLEQMRTVAIIYYFGNENWQVGDGGETGLYHTSNDEEPMVKVPPIPNSILLFEVTPLSFHGFMSNRVTERNTLIQWFHTEKDSRLRLFPKYKPVFFKDKT